MRDVIRLSLNYPWLAGGWFIVFTSLAVGDETPKQDYVFAYFIGNGEDGLHLAHSTDGLNWTALKGGESFLRPEAGDDKLMRDPSIVRGPDGTFHMVWTVSWHEKSIGYSSSRDLIHWTPQQTLPVMKHEAKAANCWAPEIFYDDATETYIIVWSTTIPGRFTETEGQPSQSIPEAGSNHRLYCVTTRDFKIYTDTRLFYDQKFNVIDGAIAKIAAGSYVLFLKDETNVPLAPQKNIRIAFAEAAAGPYGPASAPITGDFWAEGPSPLKIGDQWYVYFDCYREDRYGAVTSRDLKHWTDISDQLKMPPDATHGTAFAVPQGIASILSDVKPAQ